MRVDLLNSGLWEDFNEKLKADLDIEPEGQCRAYPGLAAALTELALGTSLFFSHKKTVAVVQGETWAFESVLPHLYKQGLQVVEVKPHQVTDWTEWVAQLPKDTSFVLWSEDHPVTGAFNSREDLDEALNNKRIFSICVSHSAHLHQPRTMRPYSVRVCCFDDEIVIAQAGVRFRTPPLFVHRSLWNDAKLMAFRAALQMSTHQDEAAVKNFEQQLKTTGWGFEVFPIAGDRLWDRAVIFNPNLNSEVILTELLAGSGANPLRAPGFERRAESINSCRWNFQPELRSWWDPLPDELILRGLLVLDVQTLLESGFAARLGAAAAKARI